MAGKRWGGVLEFGPILAANSVPVVGVVRFDPAFTLVFLLYWFELLVLFAVYGGCAMVAQRETVTEDRGVGPVVVGAADGPLSELPAITLPGSLPAVQLRNLRVIVPTAAVVGVVMVAIGETLIGGHEAHDPFPGWLAEFTSPVVLVSALGIVAAHVVYVYRGYVRPRRYEETSAATVLELPVRIAVVLLVAVIGLFAAFVAVGGFALAVASQSVADRVGLATLLGGFVALKTGIDWARFRAERSPDPDGLAAWLAPEEFRSNWGERS